MSFAAGVTSFASLTVTQVGAHTRIDAGGTDSVTLLNALVSDIDASDFIII